MIEQRFWLPFKGILRLLKSLVRFCSSRV